MSAQGLVDVRVLGAPVSYVDSFIERWVLRKVADAVELADALVLLDDTQAQFMMLKYCVCTRMLFLVRMMPRHSVQEALRTASTSTRKALDALLGGSAGSLMTDAEWSRAQLPTRFSGLGLQNPELVAPALRQLRLS